MSGIRGKDTKPEMIVRRALHRAGFRYRLHEKRLPGKPDIVLPKYKAVIFVHGCFWHGHGCKDFKWPKTREEWWRAKIEGNVERDHRDMHRLAAMGWQVRVLWECSLQDDASLLEFVFPDRPRLHEVSHVVHEIVHGSIK